jgi:5-bromo-4-chloroindolyl phosphate hydrolysis protein
MTEIPRQILSGLAAAAALALLFLFTDFVFLFSLVVSAAIGAGVYFSIPRKRSPDEIEVAPGVTKAQLDAALAKIDLYVGKFKAEAGQARDLEIRTTVGEIVQVLKRIGRNFREDPRDLTLDATPMFLEEVLDRSLDLVSRYVVLSRIAHDGAAAGCGREALETAEQSIRQVKKGFEAFFQQCLRDDLRELEVGGETLKAIMEMNTPNLDLDDLERSDR